MKMSRQGGKVALKKKDVFLTSFPLEEFRFDPMPMDPSHPFAFKNFFSNKRVRVLFLSRTHILTRNFYPSCVKQNPQGTDFYLSQARNSSRFHQNEKHRESLNFEVGPYALATL